MTTGCCVAILGDMSTEFHATTTDEFAFLRFAGSTDGPNGERVRATCFEFGTMSNFEAVRTAMDAGERFVPFAGSDMADDPTDRASLEALVVAGRVTFGRDGRHRRGRVRGNVPVRCRGGHMNGWQAAALVVGVAVVIWWAIVIHSRRGAS